MAPLLDYPVCPRDHPSPWPYCPCQYRTEGTCVWTAVQDGPRTMWTGIRLVDGKIGPTEIRAARFETRGWLYRIGLGLPGIINAEKRALEKILKVMNRPDLIPGALCNLNEKRPRWPWELVAYTITGRWMMTEVEPEEEKKGETDVTGNV